MNKNLRISRLLFALLLLTAAPSVHAQWRNLAPGLLDFGSPQDFIGGALCFKDGDLWAGLFDLFGSADLGKTWTKHTPAFQAGEYILDIDFFSNLDGIVVTNYSNAFVTHDGGLTWNHAAIPKTGLVTLSGFFIGSPQTIAVLVESRGVYMSTDGGITWTETLQGRGSPKPFGRGLGGGTAYMLQEDPSVLVNPSPASLQQVMITNDFGATWSPLGAGTAVDCWMFAVDSCDKGKIAIANEAGTFSNFPNNDSASMLSTIDGGNTWRTSFVTPRFDICGSVSASANAVFAQTRNNGIIRSLDHGISWKTIRGPCNHWDTRGLAVAGDNIIFAIDSTDGSVWGTFNCGGDSLAFPRALSGLIFTSDSLFTTDSLLFCDKQIVRPLHFRKFGCTPPQIGSITIVDTTNYYYAETSGDSINVTFRPTRGGTQTKMILTLSDGSVDTVYLLGTIKPSKPLTISSADQSTDTIGGTVYIPIIANGLDNTRDIEMVIRYDPSLQYLGSFSPSNVPLDIAGQQWPGHSKLHINGATSGVVLGYMEFTVFPDSASEVPLTIDSVVVTDPNPPCEYEYVGALPFEVQVAMPKGCGTRLITKFLLTGRIPNFSIRPNPASTLIELEVDRSVGVADIDIVDELGAIKQSLTTELPANEPRSIDIHSLPAGTYQLQVRSSSGTISKTLTILR